jgi:hypothetical protein
MEPYATMFENERPESRIIPELCLPDVDKLFVLSNATRSFPASC